MPMAASEPRPGRSAAIVLVAVALITGTQAFAAGAIQPIPIPRPRPPDLGYELRLGEQDTSPPESKANPSPVVAPPEQPAEPQPSACQKRLAADLAEFEPVPSLAGPSGCGADDVVQLRTILAPEHQRIEVAPPATLRCSMAEAVAHWVRDEVVPATAMLGAPLTGIVNFDSYECRARNRIVGAPLSQHGLANALDVRAVVLANNKPVQLTDISVVREFRERLRQSACSRFTTVLGPGSDGYHEDHIHLDLAERHNGYRLCQWAVRDVDDLVPIPQERPASAPPREDESSQTSQQ